MAKATLNKNGIATKAGDMTVYNFDGETREYLSASVEFLAVGVGIPANSCTDAPVDAKDGFAVCRATSLDGWEYVIDHRGETVYDTESGQPVEVRAVAAQPVGRVADRLGGAGGLRASRGGGVAGVPAAAAVAAGGGCSGALLLLCGLPDRTGGRRGDDFLELLSGPQGV